MSLLTWNTTEDIEIQLLDWLGFPPNSRTKIKKDCIKLVISALKNDYTVLHFEYQKKALEALGVNVNEKWSMESRKDNKW